MKFHIQYFFWFMLCMLMTQSTFCQKHLEKASKISVSGKVDSALKYLDTYENKFAAEEKWDSLAGVKIKRLEIFRRKNDLQAMKDLQTKTEEFLLLHIDKNSSLYLDFLVQKAKLESELGNFKHTQEICDEIIKRCEIISDTSGIKEAAKVQKSFNYLFQGDYKSGMKIAKDVLPALEKKGRDTFSIMQAYVILVYSYNYYHQLDSALYYNFKNLDLSKQKFGNDHPNVGISYGNIAGTYREMGKVNKSLEYHHRAISNLYRDYIESGNSRYFSNSLGNIGLIYSNLGENSLALEHLEMNYKLDTATYSENNRQLLWICQAITEVSIKNREYDKAWNYLRHAEKILKNDPTTDEYDTNYLESYEAQILFQTKQYNAAINRALNLFQFYSEYDSEYTKDKMFILNIIANSYKEMGNHSKALHWNKILLHHTKNYYNTKHTETLLPLLGLLESHIALANTQEAHAIKDTILRLRNNGSGQYSISQTIPDIRLLEFTNIWASYLGRDISDQKSMDEYFGFLSEFEDYLEIHLATVRTNTQVSGISEKLRNIYKSALQYYTRDCSERALIIAEKVNSFSTRLMLQSELVHDDDNDNPETELRESVLNSKSNTENNLKAFMGIGKSLDKYASYKDSLRVYNPKRYAEKFGFTDINLNKLSENLYEGELMIEYMVVDSTVYILTYDGKEINCSSTDFTKVKKSIQKLRQRKSNQDAKDLYRLLIPKNAENYDQLLILPDDILYYLSFEELTDPTGVLLLDKVSIRYAYSGSILHQQNILAESKELKKNLISLTPGFTSEMKDKYRKNSLSPDSSWLYFIQQPFLLRLSSELSRIDKSESYVKEEATEAKFKERARDFNIIHLGTHGELNNSSPLFSKLIFAKDKTEDGYLHTYEIYGQSLNAKLAVLSACNSGSGQLNSGDGVISLAHAFTRAGCPSILMTLWEVDEKSTVEILEYFYDYLEHGERKSIALHKAKKKYLKNAPVQLRSPYYWSGLVLMGNDSPITVTSSERASVWLWVIGLMAILILWAVVRYRASTRTQKLNH